MKKLVVFDFDGTLTKRDSFFYFLKTCFPFSKISIGALILFPVLVLYKVKMLNNDLAKEKVLKFFWKGIDANSFQQKCNWFSQEIIPKLLTASAKKCLKEYESNGFEIVILSASPEIYLKPWCNTNKYQCLSTKLKIEYGKYTGAYDGDNCRGIVKLNRLKEAFRLEEYNEIHAYGDTDDDKIFMAIAHHQFFKAL